jgi:hypothetical protein
MPSRAEVLGDGTTRRQKALGMTGECEPVQATRPLTRRVSNCLDCQEVSAVFACQHVWCVSMAFKIVSRVRRLAVKATFVAFPAARRRS